VIEEQEIRQKQNIPPEAVLAKRVETKRYVSFLFHHIIYGALVDGDRILVKVRKDTGETSVDKKWTLVSPAVPPPGIPLRLRFLLGRTEKVLVDPDDPFYIWEEKPLEHHACLFTWRKGRLTIRDAYTRKVIGHGAPPPKGFCYSGPHEGVDIWHGWRESAEKWFKEYGLEIISGFNDCALIGRSVSNPEVLFYYALAHGGSTVYTCGVGKSMTASTLKSYMQNRPKMTLAFIGHCGGMCSTGGTTFSNALRKGSMEGTGTFGYCDMATDKCNDAWRKSLIWQERLFEYLKQGMTFGDAFEESIADYPECEGCMRFCGDESAKVEGGEVANIPYKVTVELEPETKKYDVLVQVFKKNTTTPILEASVSMADKHLTTGSTGRCIFSGITSGEYTITIKASGYKDEVTTITLPE